MIYWEADEKNGIKRNRAHAKTTTYRYYNYSSGYIHHATINRLKVHYNKDTNIRMFCGSIL